MKALRFDRTGSLDALRVIEMETPVPGESEALVRVHGAGVNPSDVKNVLGRFDETTVPRTPGRDFSGVVEIGPTEWNGREVWGTGAELGFTHNGTHAEYIVMPVSGLTLKPVSLSFALAASCGVPYTTAWSALRRGGLVVEERRVVIVGVGAVGRAALSLAHVLGPTQSVAAARETDTQATRRPSGLPHVMVTSCRPV